MLLIIVLSSTPGTNRAHLMNAVTPAGFLPNAKLEKNCLFTEKKLFKIIGDFSYVLSLKFEYSTKFVC